MPVCFKLRSVSSLPSWKVTNTFMKGFLDEEISLVNLVVLWKSFACDMKVPNEARPWVQKKKM